MLLDQIGGVANDLSIENRSTAPVIKSWNGYTPGALARNAPVGSGLDGGFDPVPAPIGNPIDAFNGIESNLTECPRASESAFAFLRELSGVRQWMIDFDEPLVHGAENHGRFA